MTRFGLILAGGQARRMGGADKALAQLKGRHLIEHVAERLTPQVDQVLISGRADYGSEMKVLTDGPVGPAGPAAGLFAAAQYLADHPASIVIAVPVDAPFLPLDLVERLCAGSLPAVAHAGERLQPAFSAWTQDELVAQLARHPAGQGLALGQLARDANARTVKFDDPGAFFNINSADDLAAAEARSG